MSPLIQALQQHLPKSQVITDELRLLAYGSDARSAPTRPRSTPAMIGGIAANNASGMCCGTAQNSYRTLAGMRVVLADGTRARHEDADSRAAFAQPRRPAATGRALAPQTRVPTPSWPSASATSTGSRTPPATA
jgi:hypothetical protein